VDTKNESELAGVRWDELSIPQMPKVVTKLQELTADPESSIQAVVAVVESDPGLASKCLRLANSAIYGLRSPAASLRHAASVLGMRAIRDLAMQTTVAGAYEHLRAFRKFDLELFWKHSAATAAAARRLARYSRLMGTIDFDAIAACGLLHNIGRLAMLEAFKKEYIDVIVPAGSFGESALECERDAFGFDHAAAGAHLARAWKLSFDMIASARDHHGSFDKVSPMAALVGLSNLVAHAALQNGERGVTTVLTSPEASLFGVPPESHGKIVEGIVASLRENVFA